MRILYAAIDQTVPGPVGGAVHVEAVARGLASRGHEVHVLATPGEGGFPSNGAVWHEMRPPLARRQLRWMRSGDVLALARQLAPDAIIERYYNFGGEGVRAALETGALAVLEVNAPVIDYPGSPKHFARSRASCRADAQVARLAVSGCRSHRHAQRADRSDVGSGGADSSDRVGRRHGQVPA